MYYECNGSSAIIKVCCLCDYQFTLLICFLTFKLKLKAIGYSGRLALVTNRKAKNQNIRSKQENDILTVAGKGFSVPFGKLEDRKWQLSHHIL